MSLAGWTNGKRGISKMSEGFDSLSRLVSKEDGFVEDKIPSPAVSAIESLPPIVKDSWVCQWNICEKRLTCN